MNEPSVRKRLLFVEDDGDNLVTFSMLLDGKYAVFGYRSATEAMSAIDEIKPDLLLLDIGMHPVDGLECLKAIRAMPGYGGIPALALTGFARAVERRKFLDGGFQEVVVKPVLDFRQLVAVIDGLLKIPNELDAGGSMTTPSAPRCGESNGSARA